MCGFVGAYSKKKLSESNISLLDKMNKIISHRGPDNKGNFKFNNFACVFSRLSIIDINELAAPLLEFEFIISEKARFATSSFPAIELLIAFPNLIDVSVANALLVLE